MSTPRILATMDEWRALLAEAGAARGLLLFKRSPT